MDCINGDTVLIARALRGDRDAVNILLENALPAIRGQCLLMMKHTADADDAVQETLIRVHAKLGQFNGVGSTRQETPAQFSTWVYRIAYSVCVNQLRRKGRRTHGGTMESYSDDHIGSASGVAELIDRDTVRLAVRAAFSNLSDNHRQILLMKYRDRMKYDQIMEVLEIPRGTVRSRLFQARRFLADRLSRVARELELTKRTVASRLDGDGHVDTEDVEPMDCLDWDDTFESLISMSEE